MLRHRTFFRHFFCFAFYVAISQCSYDSETTTIRERTIVSYSVKLRNIYLTGSSGYWLCASLLGESLIWCGIVRSAINFYVITGERYLKVVYPVWSKKALKSWQIRAAMAFAWVGAVTYTAASTFPTTAVIDGTCYPYAIFRNESAKLVHVLWNFVSLYVLTLLIFVFCYWRILVVIRRQAGVMAGHGVVGVGSSSTQAQSNRIQNNVIKTMILVSGFYAVLWLPHHLLLLLLKLNVLVITSFSIGYYASLFMAFLYTCGNPFIYATKFYPVKQVLRDLLRCKKPSVQAANSGMGT